MGTGIIALRSKVELAKRSSHMTAALQPLLEIGRRLQRDRYRFIAPTPLTYQRVLGRRGETGSLRDIFGWNRPFDMGATPAEYRTLLQKGDLLTLLGDGRATCRIRFSTLDDLLLAHSGFPTTQPDAVFFGPDTYRFARELKRIAAVDPAFTPRSVVDVGAGTGAGGFVATKLFPSLKTAVLGDINPQALTFSGLNAQLNDIAIAHARESDVLGAVADKIDLIISNPPYLVDASHRAYRHGGGRWGCELALRILDQGLTHLAPEGRLMIYTGSPIVGGQDMFLRAATPILLDRTKRYRYEEIYPDVFGEELEAAPYDAADRIATVALHVKGYDLKR